MVHSPIASPQPLVMGKDSAQPGGSRRNALTALDETMTRPRARQSILTFTTLGLMCVAAVATAQQQGASGQAAEAMQPGTLPATPGNVINMILVKVNNDPILLTDLETTVDSQVELLRQQLPEEEIAAQLPQLQRTVLIGLIDQKMMQQRAEDLGITADANMVDSQIRRLREANDITSDEEFQQALAEVGMTADKLREQVRDTLRQQQLVQQEVNRSVFVSEGEIAQYYNEHAEEFEAPTKVRLRQLIFLTAGGDSEALMQQAHEALAELQGGGDYATVSSKYVNATAMTGEDTFIAMNELNEALSESVPDMPVGAYELVQSKFGFHIVSVLERQDRSVAALDDVSQAIRQRLTSEKSQKAIQDYLVGLRERTRLTNLDPTHYPDIEAAWKAQSADQQEQSQ